MAMAQAIQIWEDSPDRNSYRCISLMVALIYLINALNSRPEEFTAEKAIVACLTKGSISRQLIQVTNNEESGAEEDQPQGSPTHRLSTARLRWGILFPSDMIGHSDSIAAPHLGEGLLMENLVFEKLLGSNLMFLVGSYESTSRDQSEITFNVPRMTRKGPRTYVQHPGPSSAEEEITLSVNDYKFRIGFPPQTYSPEELVQIYNERASRILARFYMDIMYQSPNESGQGGGPYCHYSMQRIRRVTAADFSDPNLATVWRKCIVLKNDFSRWNTSVEFLFPLEREQTKGPRQNYGSCPYYSEWLELLSPLEMSTRQKLQDEIKVREGAYL
jgi:hypothetical protein